MSYADANWCIAMDWWGSCPAERQRTYSSVSLAINTSPIAAPQNGHRTIKLSTQQILQFIKDIGLGLSFINVWLLCSGPSL